jgi:16S rRNA (cytosine967-C5)-methyltransferase
MMKNNSTTRRTAVDCLGAILSAGVNPKDALDRFSAGFEARERAFLSELVYGTIRYRDSIDWMLRPFLKNPKGVSARTLNNIRLAVYQIVYTRVPPRAAVNEAVEVARPPHQEAARPRTPGAAPLLTPLLTPGAAPPPRQAEKAGGMAPLVNAVLRSFLRASAKAQFPPFDTEPAEHIARAESFPLWMAQRWVDRFGPLEALMLARADNDEALPTLRVNTLLATVEEISLELTGMRLAHERTQFSPHGIRLSGRVPIDVLRPLLGRVFIQDEASQLASLLLSPKKGQSILDACAAPGGKTLHIAALTGNDAFVLALDDKPRRLIKLNENVIAARARCVHAVAADMLRPPLKGFYLFDRVLLDAPCSATGIIRKNPDVKYRVDAARLAELARVQLKLLRAASAYLKKGGVMVYAVCSTEVEEGEDVIRSFLKENREFYIEDSREVMTSWGTDISALSTGERFFLRTYPHLHGMDGFFFARLGRR